MSPYRSPGNNAPSVQQAGRDGLGIRDLERLPFPALLVENSKLLALESFSRHIQLEDSGVGRQKKHVHASGFLSALKNVRVYHA